MEAAKELFSRHRSRYGGHLVHLGVVVCTVGITASMAHKIEKEFSLSVGEKFEVGRFFLQLNNFDGQRNANYEALHADVTLGLNASGETLKTLYPESRFYFRNKEQTTEVALRVGLREDVYLSLAGVDESGTRATFKVFINPLQIWLWVGGVIILLGTIVVLIPSARTKADSVAV
jgi:cytochrome c-type biogenesis protein CcmF